MPKGPQGQKRPADAVARAVMVGRIATGEIIDEIPSGIKGAAGGAARAARLRADERRAISSKAAQTRWGTPATEIRRDVMQPATKETVARHGRKAACMYPNNSLGNQKKELAAAFSGVEMLLDRFKN